MSNPFILKLSGGLLLASLSACGTSSLIDRAIPLKEATSSPHILDQVSLAQSRDILLRTESKSAYLELLNMNPNLKDHKLLSQEKQIHWVKLENGFSLTRAISDLKTQEGVRYAEPNPGFKLPDYALKNDRLKGFQTQAVQPNDPQFGLQWNMKSSKIDEAWELTTANNNIKVAVIDSGVDPNHEDLSEYLEPLEDIWNETKGSDVYVDVLSRQEYNFGGKDGNGHGTHVTGIIAAQMNNRKGVAGVAGAGIKIIPIKATKHDGNTDAAVLTMAFQRAIDRGANVINISIGGPRAKSTRALEDVISLALKKNISIVSATGNESSRPSGLISAITVPAGYPGVIAVGSHTEFNKVASYSNGGPEIDLVAPGGGGRDTSLGEGQRIWSTWPSYKTFEFFQRRVVQLTYAATSGTSMSCPHVTGVVALMLSREPHLTPSQIRSRLIATADDLDVSGFDQATGYGKLNALKALQWVEHDAH